MQTQAFLAIYPMWFSSYRSCPLSKMAKDEVDRILDNNSVTVSDAPEVKPMGKDEAQGLLYDLERNSKHYDEVLGILIARGLVSP